jgi:predicted transcriptional regulator
MKPTSREDCDTVVISFRAPAELVKKLDKLAQNDDRNRANFILLILARATSEHLVQDGEFWLKAFHDSYAKDPVGRETEFWRGQVAGWKRTLVSAYGANIAEQIILRASKVANLPVPHSGTLSADGRGYEGFDSFSHGF